LDSPTPKTLLFMEKILYFLQRINIIVKIQKYQWTQVRGPQIGCRQSLF